MGLYVLTGCGHSLISHIVFLIQPFNRLFPAVNRIRGGRETKNYQNGWIGANINRVIIKDQNKSRGDPFSHVNIAMHLAQFSSYINYALRLSAMQYGDRCRATSSLRGLYPSRYQTSSKNSLTPQYLVSKESAPRTKLISGRETSTPTVSSQKKLLNELLEIIKDLSDAKWTPPDDLDISLQTLSSSSQDTTSSSDSEDWVRPDTPPPTPPQ
nr:ORF3 [Torque teno felis virus]